MPSYKIDYKTTRRDLLRHLPGWRWDGGVWVDRFESNVDFRLSDRIDTSDLDELLFRSGANPDIGALDFTDVEFGDLNEWYPGVAGGWYHSHNRRGYLHPTGSIAMALPHELIGNFTQVELDYDTDRPVSVEYLSRDIDTCAVTASLRMTQVESFQGIRFNGVEMLVTDAHENAQSGLNQFRVITGESEEIVEQLPAPVVVGTAYTFALSAEPRRRGLPTFTTAWPFVKAMPPSEFFAKLWAPAANGPLDDGDWTVQGSSLTVNWTGAAPASWGQIRYWHTEPTKLIFVDDLRRATVHVRDVNGSSSIFYLESFPVEDYSVYSTDSFGPVVLDTSSFELRVDGVLWDRVEDISAVVGLGNWYQLDPLLGVVTFGDGTNGTLPAGTITTTYNQVPLLQYTPIGVEDVFVDEEEDLNPLSTALRGGFLVLDTRRLEPALIDLKVLAPARETASGICCHGPLLAPPTPDTLIRVQARVTSKGSPRQPIPNEVVTFHSTKSYIAFTSAQGVTDAQGYAYTDMYARVGVNEMLLTSHMYAPLNPAFPVLEQVDPAGLAPQAYVFGPVVSAPDTIVFPERIDPVDLNEIYLIITSIPADTPGNFLDYAGVPIAADDYAEPHNARTREGGLSVVWHHTVAGAEEIVHPIAVGAGPTADSTAVQFPINVPTGRLITAYRLCTERIGQIYATTENLASSQRSVCVSLDSTAKGQWTIPDPPDFESGRIDSATYISPNDVMVAQILDATLTPTAALTVGANYTLQGMSFPTTAELYMPAFIIQVDNAGRVIAATNISDTLAFVDSTTITVTGLPAPPGALGGTYWLALAGLSDSRASAVEVTIS